MFPEKSQPILSIMLVRECATKDKNQKKARLFEKKRFFSTWHLHMSIFCSNFVPEMRKGGCYDNFTTECRYIS